MDSSTTLRVHKRLPTAERREKLPHLIANTETDVFGVSAV